MIRPLQRSDHASVRMLWNRHVTFDPMTDALFCEKVWNDADFRPELTWVSEHHGQLTGFVMGILRQSVPHLSPVGYIKLLVVDAAHRRQGIGSQLLHATERVLKQARADTIRVCESAPNYLTPGLDRRYTAGKCFFETHSYEHIDTVYNLTVDLTQSDFASAESETHLATQGIRVRRATPGDTQMLLAWVRTHWPVWQAEVKKALANHPISLHLARSQNHMLAFSAYDSNNLGTGWFGPMGTVPTAEGQGLGRVLLWRCLRDQKAQGHTTAIIPWVGPIDFYRRHAGAQIARVFDRYEKRID